MYLKQGTDFNKSIKNAGGEIQAQRHFISELIHLNDSIFIAKSSSRIKLPNIRLLK